MIFLLNFKRPCTEFSIHDFNFMFNFVSAAWHDLATFPELLICKVSQVRQKIRFTLDVLVFVN